MLLELLGVAGVGTYVHKRFKRRKSLQHILSGQAVTPFTGDLRERQIREFNANSLHQKSQRQRQADRNLLIAVSSFSLALAGKLYAPLTLLSLPGILYIAHFSVLHAYEHLKKKELTLDLLSALTKVFLIGSGYFALAAFSTCLYTVNRKLLNKISDESKKSLIDVFKQQPSYVWVVHNGLEREVPFETLTAGDTVVIHAGSVIPVDGVIIEGSAAIDQHILTGEFQPVEKAEGDEVFALTLVLSGKVYVRAHKTGEQTSAAQIAEILNDTINTKTDIQLWAREISDKTVMPTLVLSGLLLPVLGPTSAVVVITSHFKYRVSIAAAIGVLQYLNQASHNGILIKDGHTFELLKQVDTVVFDKTGTLTEEQPTVATVYACEGYTQQEVLRYAAAAETRQTHPIARAILHAAGEQHLELPEVEDTDYQLGYGLTVKVEGSIVRVGSLRFLQQEGLSIPEAIVDMQTGCYADGTPMIAVAQNNRVIGAIELVTRIRAGTHELISALRERGITATYIISGDHEGPTRKLAQELGIDHYFAEVLPEQKAEIIARIQAEGRRVCYIGDGINDSIALKQADVSISIRGASTVATDAAQIVLMDQHFGQLPYLFDMGQQFSGHMKKVAAAVIAPTILVVGGVLFFPITLVQSLLFPQVGLMLGVLTAMRPPVKRKSVLRQIGLPRSKH